MPSLIIFVVVLGVILGAIIGSIATKKYHYLCLTLFLIFTVLTGWYYSQSSVPIEKNTASYLGIENVMNLQATIFTAACAIISIICLLGFLLTKQRYEQE